MSGSAAIRLRNSTIAFFGVDQALVHVDVDDLGAVRDLVARDVERGGVVAGGDQLAELGRAGDVGALADIDEGNVVGQRERLQARTAASAARCSGTARGGCFATASAMARIWSGVEPQQPPTMLTRPSRAKSSIWRGHELRALVILAEFVGQAGIGIGADEGVGDAGELGQMRRAWRWRRARS